MKKFKLSFMKLLLMFGLIPLMFSVSIVDTMACEFLKSTLQEDTKTVLQVAAVDLANYYHAQLTDKGEISEDRTYIDSFQGEDIELTLCIGDTRMLSSIKDADGNSIEGTKADSKTVDEVINKGNSFFSKDLSIAGKEYYAYSAPLKDADNTVIGIAFAGKTAENVQEASDQLFNTFIIVGTINICLFALIIILLARTIKRPFGKIADSLEILANGDLSQEILIKSKINETGRIIDSAKKLQDNLRRTVSNVRDTAIALSGSVDEVNDLSSHIAEGTNQITNAVSELSSGAVNMADNVQNVNIKVVNIGQSINDITDNVENLGTSSSVMKKSSNDAENSINGVLKCSSESVDAVERIAAQIELTNQTISKITETVDMISSISEETELLSLNASIEASHAGDAGRGFAVVAENIKKLSEQSGESANIIKALADDMIKQSSLSVSLANEIKKIIAREQSEISDTQAKFETLNKEIETSIEKIAIIGTMTENISNVKNEIVENVSELSAISEENAASNQEVTASVETMGTSITDINHKTGDMKALADNLNQAISVFKQ